MVRVHSAPDLHRSLIEAATRLLDSEGIEAVTIRACAKACGVSHAAPAKYFASRRALLTELAAQCMADLTNDAEQRMAEAPGQLRTQLEAMADAAVGYAMVRPNRYRLIWRTDLLNSRDPELMRTTGQLFGLIEAQVARFPQLPHATPKTLVIAICSMIHGYVSLRIDGNFRPASDEAIPRPRQHALIDLLLGTAD